MNSEVKLRLMEEYEGQATFMPGSMMKKGLIGKKIPNLQQTLKRPMVNQEYLRK